MCGIAGFSGGTGSDFGSCVMHRLAHRGPDANGRFDSPDGSVSLFHTRLAIQDPTPDGDQPMLSADGRVAIAFNGEIYNFLTLRKELQAKNHQFRSRCDTEVLLALYLEHGEDMLGHLNGIYAFAIWDSRDSKLFIARDGLGVKPLYVSEDGNAFSFASEIKALLCFPWIELSIDTQAIAHYVRYLWCPGSRTPLSSVKKLGPGEAIVVKDGSIARRWQHYDLPAPGADQSVSVSEWTASVRQSLETAVRRQMVSDVPLGAFLSGGLDSSAVAAYARRHSHGPLQCFTIDFDDELSRKEGFVRDLPYARRVAEHLDVDLHVVNVDSTIADELGSMVWQLDEPLADFSALNVMYISRLARDRGIKVLLSGAGGDDIFTGYRRHRALNLENTWKRLPTPLRRLMSGAAGYLPRRSPSLRRLSKLLASASLEGDARLASYFDWASSQTSRSLFRPEVREGLTEEPLLDALNRMPSSATPLQRMLLLEQQFFLTDHNLNYTDKMSMAAGVETRVPFLDPELVSLAARIPDQYRQRGAEGKWIFKRAMEGILPDDVIYRSKTGFGVPLRAWLRGPLRPLMHDLLSEGAIRRRGLFDPDAVSRLVSENDRGCRDHAYSILSIMCIETWCQKFLDDRAKSHAA